MKPTTTIANRLLDLQTVLAQDAERAKSREMAGVMEALALLAEGVGKTSRDVRELSMKLRGKSGKKAGKPKAPEKTV